VRCGQGDNLMVHAVMDRAQPGDVLVLTMPEPQPVALIGDLLATQAGERGVAALLVDAAVRDVADLRELGLPIWARWIRVKGATKTEVGTIDEPVEVGGATIRPGDLVVLDDDGAVVVRQERAEQVLAASRERLAKERVKRERLRSGQLSYDLDGLRARVEGE
jgi:4-hydroxy-4-methyl-2-oxoglutarate aldolase